MRVNHGYESLADVLQRALDQAQDGKGAERHADGKPFDQQPMQQLISLFGTGFAGGQAAKKAQESMRMEHDAAVRELLGGIVYLAGAIVHMERRRGKPAVAANDNAKRPPVVDLTRFGELEEGTLLFIMRCAEASMLSKQADKLQGREHG